MLLFSLDSLRVNRVSHEESIKYDLVCQAVGTGNNCMFHYDAIQHTRSSVCSTRTAIVWQIIDVSQIIITMLLHRLYSNNYCKQWLSHTTVFTHGVFMIFPVLLVKVVHTKPQTIKQISLCTANMLDQQDCHERRLYCGFNFFTMTTVIVRKKECLKKTMWIPICQVDL